MAVSSGPAGSLRGMGARFIGLDREQVFLMPSSVRVWVPEGHLVWTVLEAVAELDLSGHVSGLPGGRARSSGLRAVDDGRAVALRVRARDPVLAWHRARVRRGRRLSRGHGQRRTRSLDDRRVRSPARAAALA